MDGCDTISRLLGANALWSKAPALWLRGVAGEMSYLWMPPFTLESPTTFSFPPIVTALTVGAYQMVTQTISGSISASSSYATSVITTTITIPAVTTSIISWFDVTATNNSTVLFLVPSITQTSYVITEPNTFYSSSISPVSRTFYPPPWPGTTIPPTLTTPTNTASTQPSTSQTVEGGRTVHHTNGPPSPQCTHALGCGSHCNPLLSACSPCWLFCDGPPGLDGVAPVPPPPPPSPGPPPTGTEDQDPKNSNPQDEGDRCDPNLSDEQGLCDNGNFPLYNPGTGKIDCSYSPADAQSKISACQAEAMDDQDRTLQIINQAKTCCAPARKRSILERTLQLFRRADACMPTEPEPIEDESSPDIPMRTYTCPSKFPNVCANARSAISARGESETMTRQEKSHHYTGPWYLNKKSSQTVEGKNENLAIAGWGLEGCNVEEYPFGTGNPSTEAVIRLIPIAENAAHGEDFQTFLDAWDLATGNADLDEVGSADLDEVARTAHGRSINIKKPGKPFKIAFGDGVADASTQWGLWKSPSDNVCDVHGADFLLRGGPPESSLQWDPYFSREGRMRTYTVTYNKGSPGGKREIVKTSTIPPQYCTAPSPGRQTLIDNTFRYVREDGVTIGKPKPAKDAGYIGTCEPWPPAGVAEKIKVRDGESANTTLFKDPDVLPQKKRHHHPRHAPALTFRGQLVEVGDAHVLANASQHDTHKHALRHRPGNGLKIRQLSSGSYLDPNVYAFLGCSNDDYDPCDWGQICDGSNDGADDGDDGDGSDGDSSASTTAVSSEGTSSTVVTESSAPTTESSPTTTKSSSVVTTSATTRTTTIYVLSTATITSTSQVISTLGAMTITANIRAQVVANAIAQVSSTTTTKSQITLGPRANFIVSDYNLNYIASHTGTSTYDVCSAGNFDVYGVGKPKPDHWYDYPASVSFVSTISLDDTGVKLSSCSYTNPAAPSAGDGGELACGSTTYPCIPYLFGPATFYCNYDDLAGYMTTMDILAQCVVTTTGETVFTTTSVATATSVSVIVS
ncbi:Glucan endo-1,3-alpha-glucosidase agn1 [Elasticomyces elasticus]|nr:Glucan endo-1,3-alpha-glucosidase agn1 [Elasticomyces elasticus]